MKRCYFLIISICLLLSACSSAVNSNSNLNSKQFEQEQHGKPMQPISEGKFGEIERDFLVYPGKYSGKNYNETAIRTAIEQVPTTWTREKYLQFIYSIAAEDYRPFIKNFQNLSTDVQTSLPKVNGKIILPAEKKYIFPFCLMQVEV